MAIRALYISPVSYDLINAELLKSAEKHGKKPFNSLHEGYAVLLEEVEELWAEVKKSEIDYTKLRAEAVQVAAMAIRIINELT